ncbi:MAG: beta-galactosidase [Clostridiales bacterium]|nr:beta-galactosidase [Clostridiales bacterium]
MKNKSIKLAKPTLATCYYPEHWEEGLWAEDLQRMQAHGIEVVRVFEFAWAVVEPYENVFDFSLFDRFLALAQQEKMEVILCTPTATPPAWLTSKYPEVLNVDKNGNVMHHGHRRHYNYNSPKYLYFTERIVKVLGQRYGNHPAVIGWQIDNEVNCEVNVFYSDSDRKAFRQYVKEHFGTLEALNDAIGGNFWSQRYTDWDQVDLARHTLSGEGNPHMALLEKRFFSKSAIRYIKLQSDLLRKYIGNRFITTNGIFGHLDNFELVDTALDFMTYDSYPNFVYGESGINGTDTGLADRSWSMHLSYARALSPNFGIMEQQSGANGWDFTMMAPMPKPGQMRMWTLQSIAHGADFVSYFRWRTCSYGTEIYWHGLNDYSNQPNRRLEELKATHEDLEKIPSLAGSIYQAQVALVTDYLNQWDGERDLWHGPLEEASRQKIFAAAQKTHTPLDLLWIRNTKTHQTKLEELLPYKVLFYPHATILTQDTAKLLTAYVEAGGILIMGARTGYKDEYGRCPMQPMPGYARDLCGVEVTDYTLARPEDPAKILWNGKTYEAPIFHDILKPVEGGVPLATFQGCYYDGACGMTMKKHGKGIAYYVGSGFCEELVKTFLAQAEVREPYGEIVTCPEEIELACRKKESEEYFFLINYTDKAHVAICNTPLKDAFSQEMIQGEVHLTPYDARVFLRDTNKNGR